MFPGGASSFRSEMPPALYSPSPPPPPPPRQVTNTPYAVQETKGKEHSDSTCFPRRSSKKAMQISIVLVLTKRLDSQAA